MPGPKNSEVAGARVVGACLIRINEILDHRAKFCTCSKTLKSAFCKIREEIANRMSVSS